jgi:predicted enzyme related to lactoylglutathione lyase
LTQPAAASTFRRHHCIAQEHDMSNSGKNGAVIFVKYFERATAFYRDTMALTVTHEEPGLVVLENDTQQLVLHAIPAHIAATFEITDPPQAREDASVKLFFYVADFAAARAAAAAHGGRFLPADKEWVWRGFRACDGVDPEGNVVQIRKAERS